MTRLFTLLLLAALTGGTARAQTFYSFSAGTDGFNFNVTNALPFVPAVLVAEPVYVPPPPPRHHHHHHHHAPEVHYPLLPGLVYEAAAPAEVYYHEVADYYRPRRVSNGVEMEFNLIPGLVIRAGHDFDDDHHHHHGRPHHDKHYKKHHRDHHDKHYRHHEKKHHRDHEKEHHKKHEKKHHPRSHKHHH